MNAIQKEELRILLEFNRICIKHNIVYSLGYGTLLGAIRHKGFIPWDDDVDVIMLREEYNKFIAVVKQELSNDFAYVDHDVEEKYYYSYAKLRSNSVELKEASVDHLGIHQGVWIDIFPYDAIPSDEKEALDHKNNIKKYHNRFVASVLAHVQPKETGIKKVVKKTLKSINRKTRNINYFRNKWFNQQHRMLIKFNHHDDLKYTCVATNFTDHEYHASVLTRETLLNTISHTFEGHQLPIIAPYHEHLSAIYGDYMTPPPLDEQVSVHHII